MPDWITHIFAGWLLAKLFRLNGRLTSLLLMGSLMPDYISKLYLLMGDFLDQEQAFTFLLPTHTLFGTFLLGVFLAGFFPEKFFKKAVVLFSAGIVIHLFLDSLQTHLGPTMPFFYPFSTEVYGYPLIWSEDPHPLKMSIITFPIVYGLYLIAKGRVKWRRARAGTS